MRTCDELGVCNGRHCHDVAACADYDLIACNSGDCQGQDDFYPPCPHAVFECEVPCRPDPAQQTFPFAPGVIQGDGGQQIVFLGREPFPYSLRECLQIAALVVAIVAVLAFGAGYLVEWLS